MNLPELATRYPYGSQWRVLATSKHKESTAIVVGWVSTDYEYGVVMFNHSWRRGVRLYSHLHLGLPLDDEE